MTTILVTISIIAYVFIGGLLAGFFLHRNDDRDAVAALLWPILLILSLGEEFGIFLKSIFKRKK